MDSLREVVEDDERGEEGIESLREVEESYNANSMQP